MKIAIVIHAFYPEQLQIILGKIEVIIQENYHHTIDVYITLPLVKKSLQSIIESYSFSVNVHWCENKGMDLLPFFELIPNLQHYDWVLKLHTKNNDDELNKLWFDTLINELIGSPEIFKKTITILEQNRDWQMVGILPFFLSAHKLMLKNQKNADKLAKLWGLNTDKDWGFFAGSFYWIKPQALNAYTQTLLSKKEWFDDAFAKDGLFAHALERLISLAVSQIGVIGLLYKQTELFITDRYKYSINQALSYSLLENIQNLDKTIRILTEVYPLDIQKYEKICNIDFKSDELALKHYILVGQFGECADLILPIALQRKQEKLFSWQKLSGKPRIKGLVSVIIPVLNEIKLTLACLKSVKKYTKYANIEVIVVDNGSDLLISQVLNLYTMTDKRCRIVCLDENLNFAVGCNYGFSQSNGEYVLFLNNDTLVTEYWLTPLIETIQDTQILAVQSLLLYPDNTVQCAGVEFGDDGFGFSKYEGKVSQDPKVLRSQACSALTGACLLLRADDFIKTKGFGTWFINGQEDIDFCLRLKNLYPDKLLWYCADSVVFHYGSSTLGRKNSISQNRKIFQIIYKGKSSMSENTFLVQGNKAFQSGQFREAVNLYLEAIKQNDKLKSILKINIMIALQNIGESVDLLSVDSIIDKKLQSDKKESVFNNNAVITYQEAFDANFYLKTYPDIAQAGINPFEHYVSWGWRENRLPNSWFDPAYYLGAYADAKSEDKDPLLHFVEVGQFEKRVTRLVGVPELSQDLRQLIPCVKFDDVSEDYVEYKENKKINSAVKLIAFYLPQFHPFPENDTWWGKGFTEWTNVTKAQPNFEGHYQPHLPIHNGFYDLRVPEVMIEQAKLAKNYGVYGFNFYYYWFDGKILMQKPFEILLKHPEIDINYCITWANENWTRRWDGAENDVLIGQNHCEEDSIKFIEHMYQYFNDKRYIRIDNKPVLIIYRSNIIPQMKEIIDLWRKKVKDAGFDGVYLVGAQTFGFKDPNEYGFDAVVEFPPHTVKSGSIKNKLNITNNDYSGHIFDYQEVVGNIFSETEPFYKRFRTTMLSWDNTARKQNASHIFANFSMLKYKQWLSHISFNVFNNSKYSSEEKLVFVNAWNEWAEGTHLEPDRKMGYNYLQTTYDVLKEFDKKAVVGVSTTAPTKKANDYAVILHMHYIETYDDILEYLKNLDYYGFDLYVTLTTTQNGIVKKIKDTYPTAHIQLVENRGRDIRPFIDTYRVISKLGYTAVCKIHSKKSKYRDDGDKIRDELLGGLLGKGNIESIIQSFEQNNQIGLCVLESYIIAHNEKNMRYDHSLVMGLADVMGIDFEYTSFPAGSMYWFRPEAFRGIEKIEDHFFRPEEGLADGTVAHAVERIICNIVSKNDYKLSLL